MDVREKLVELIANAKYICANDYSDHTEDEYIADTLLDNGVTVQECKVAEIDKFKLPIDDAILILKEEYKQRADGYATHLSYGGKGDPAEEVGLDALAMAISALEKTKWISVDDRLPEEKVNCIVHYKHSYCDNDDYWAIGICFYDGEKFQMDLLYKVTHWQYLPQPPKGE